VALKRLAQPRKEWNVNVKGNVPSTGYESAFPCLHLSNENREGNIKTSKADHLSKGFRSIRLN
jgi:hypothetical protein